MLEYDFGHMNITSYEGVIKNHEDDKDAIKEGQGNQKLVEGGGNDLPHENHDGDTVTKQAK